MALRAASTRSWARLADVRLLEANALCCTQPLAQYAPAAAQPCRSVIARAAGRAQNQAVVALRRVVCCHRRSAVMPLKFSPGTSRHGRYNRHFGRCRTGQYTGKAQCRTTRMCKSALMRAEFGTSAFLCRFHVPDASQCTLAVVFLLCTNAERTLGRDRARSEE